MSITINSLHDYLKSIDNIEINTTITNSNGNDRFFVQYYYNNYKYPKSYQLMKQTGHNDGKDNTKYCMSGIHTELVIRGQKVYNGIHFEGKIVDNPQYKEIRNKFQKELQNRGIKFRTFNCKEKNNQFEIECFEIKKGIGNFEKQKFYQTLNDLFDCLESIIP